MESSREVRELIRQANDIYRQVGVTLDIGDRISITNIPKAYNILFEGTSETMWNFDQLVNTQSNTGGLELYFVNEFYGISGNPMGTRGCSNGFGLVVKKTGDAITLAHEIGHSLGLFDIYISNDESDEGISSADALSVETDFVQQAFLSLDWSGENHGSGTGGTRYYSSGLTMRRLIPRLLMYGIYVKGKRDLTLGSVYGVWYEEYDVGKVWHKSDAPIGTASPGSFNVNRKHL